MYTIDNAVSSFTGISTFVANAEIGYACTLKFQKDSELNKMLLNFVYTVQCACRTSLKLYIHFNTLKCYHA